MLITHDPGRSSANTLWAVLAGLLMVGIGLVLAGICNKRVEDYLDVSSGRTASRTTAAIVIKSTTGPRETQFSLLLKKYDLTPSAPDWHLTSAVTYRPFGYTEYSDTFYGSVAGLCQMYAKFLPTERLSHAEVRDRLARFLALMRLCDLASMNAEVEALLLAENP